MIGRMVAWLYRKASKTPKTPKASETQRVTLTCTHIPKENFQNSDSIWIARIDISQTAIITENNSDLAQLGISFWPDNQCISDEFFLMGRVQTPHTSFEYKVQGLVGNMYTIYSNGVVTFETAPDDKVYYF